MNRLALLPLAALLLTGATPLAQAQTRSSAVIIGVSNIDYASEGLNVYALFRQDSSALTTSGSAQQSFSGNDRDGDASTMTLTASGFGDSNYGRLRTYNQVQVSGTFYNADNAPFVNSQTGEVNLDGTPDFFDSFAAARFSDTLQYGGQLQSGYLARYFFDIHGIVSGNTVSGAALEVGIAGNDPEYVSYTFPTGESRFQYATRSYAVNGTFAQTVDVAFGTSTSGYAQQVADGETIYGVGDFSSTTTLSRIEITDANGQVVANVTATGAVGTSYSTSPVPEPATLAVLGLGTAALLRRRRRHRAR